MTTATVTEPHRPSRALRPLILSAIGALLAVAVIADGAFTLLDLGARHTFVTRSSYAGVRSLRVDVDKADVRLMAAPAGARLTVVAHVTDALDRPRRIATSSAGRLHLEQSCPLTFSVVCAVTYDIAVPSGVVVVVRSGDGNVTATGLATTSTVSLSSGDGDITATGLRATRVRLNSGNGTIDAQLAKAPEQLQASSGDGDIRLTVPNVPYAVHAGSGAGSVSDDALQINPASPRSIDATSGAGSVTIRPAR